MSEYIINLEGELGMALAVACVGAGFKREEIVRCRDCKWFTPESFYEEEREYGVKEVLLEPPDCGNPERCSNHYDSFTKKTVPVHIVTDPDGFCAWGERMGDAE